MVITDTAVFKEDRGASDVWDGGVSSFVEDLAYGPIKAQSLDIPALLDPKPHDPQKIISFGVFRRIDLDLISGGSIDTNPNDLGVVLFGGGRADLVPLKEGLPFGLLDGADIHPKVTREQG